VMLGGRSLGATKVAFQELVDRLSQAGQAD
jgi:hypothetical protein